MRKLDVIIIGCGVVGAATAYALARFDLDILILEKENDVSNGTSKANSAILHAGYDPLPGTKMASLNVKGARLAKNICQDLDVPYVNTGSFVLAFSDDDLSLLQVLFERGEKNSVEGLEIVLPERLFEMEPQLSSEVKGALFAPTAAIVNPWEFTLAMAENAVLNGATLCLEEEVVAIERDDTGFLVRTNKGMYTARFVINAAGLYADTVHNMVAPPAFKIMPDKGEYFVLDKVEGTRVKHVIFQCPTALGKGTLVAPTTDGNLIVGPNNISLDSPDDTSTSAAGLAQVKARALLSVPSIDFSQNIRNFSGVRAASEIDDFVIAEVQEAPGFFDLAAIKSPGLTAAPAIGEQVVHLLEEKGVLLTPRENLVSTRKKLRFNKLSIEEKKDLIASNADYGQIVCRCETVTLGEVKDALLGVIPAVSVEGVKRRTQAGSGRCQGGFCGPRVVEIIAKERGVSPLEVPLDKAGSQILVGRTKEAERDV